VLSTTCCLPADGHLPITPSPSAETGRNRLQIAVTASVTYSDAPAKVIVAGQTPWATGKLEKYLESTVAKSIGAMAAI